MIKLVQSLPKNMVADTVGRQLLRCGTSVGANYRAACRARSPAEFCAKMGIVEEETDESIFWMEMLGEAEVLDLASMQQDIIEANEILAMVIASIRTARNKR